MPHIGIERLSAGHREKHRAQHEKAAPRGIGHDFDAVHRIEGEEDSGLLDDAPYAERGDDGEPHQHDWTEQPADRGGAAVLHQKQPGQQNQRNRYDIGREYRGRDLQPLDCAKHCDRRGDHAVAIEQ